MNELIEEFSRNYALLALTLRDIADYAVDYTHELANRLVTENRVFESDRFAKNFMSESLIENQDFQRFLKKIKLSNQVITDPDLSRKWFLALRETEEYQAYCKLDGTENRKAEAELLRILLFNVLLQDETFDHVMEDKSISWMADKDEVVALMDKLLTDAQNEGRNNFRRFDYIKPDDREFAKRLFQGAILNADNHMREVEKAADNWDSERMSSLDLYTLIICLEELYYFNDIPVKVSINEYLELSKNFGTPKSKDFINGIVDKIVKDWKESGKLRKTGRGLIE